MKILTTPPNLRELKELAPNARAFLFDMDGTIINSEKIHAEGLRQVIANSPGEQNENLSASELEKKYFGIADHNVYLDLISEKQISTALSIDTFLSQKNNLMIEILKNDPKKLETNNEVINLLKELNDNNIKIALVTASEREITMPLLEAAKILNYFSIIITRNDVEDSKPHPGPYLMAMKKLNILSHESFIFEDSPTGLLSAKSSEADYCKVTWFE